MNKRHSPANSTAAYTRQYPQLLRWCISALVADLKLHYCCVVPVPFPVESVSCSDKYLPGVVAVLNARPCAIVDFHFAERFVCSKAPKAVC